MPDESFEIRRFVFGRKGKNHRELRHKHPDTKPALNLDEARLAYREASQFDDSYSPDEDLDHRASRINNVNIKREAAKEVLVEALSDEIELLNVRFLRTNDPDMRDDLNRKIEGLKQELKALSSSK